MDTLEPVEQIPMAWDPPARPHYTVSQLTGELREMLGATYSDVLVAGEISGAKNPPSGHFYFTLKDERAQLRCVCYRMTARYMKFKPQDGVEVLARGRVDLYDARGDMQFIVETLEPLGHGALQLAFDQLKKKLADEGLFAQERKRPLPPLPERIGIVTSPSGAVIRDMLNVLERRCPGRHIRLYPVPVQGEGAASQIAEGIGYFAASEWADVVIVGRGGGSLEDLWAFNDEMVARVIAASPVPVISAVGHETDFTIADFVADVRAPTPSAAAELVIATRQSLSDNLDVSSHKLTQSMRLTLALQSRRLREATVDTSRLRRTLGQYMQRVDEMDYRVRDAIRSNLANRRRSLDALAARVAQRDVRLRFAETRRKLEAAHVALRQSMRMRLSRDRGSLAPVTAKLEQLSPLKILDRGYAIVQHEGKVVKSPAEVPSGSALNIRVAKGNITARVEDPK